MRVGESRPDTGLTLIELIVTLAVAIILVMIALPNYSQFRQQQEVVASVNDVLGVLQSARREAINRRLDMSVVLGDAAGWPIAVKYTDPDTDNEVTALQRQSNYPSISVTWASGSGLVFNRFGRVDTEQSLCLLREAELSREAYIRISGQIEIRKGDEIKNCAG